MSMVIPFSKLRDADLIVDAIYEGSGAKNLAADPLPKLMRCGVSGGFRKLGPKDNEHYVVLTSSLEDADWPDTLDTLTGTFTYFGDNKQPGRQLHRTPLGGNRLLRRIFESIHLSVAPRTEVPPLFVFTKEPTASCGFSKRFRGLAVPGVDGMSQRDDLVAVWKSSSGERYQNYRAAMTILDEAVVAREWLEELRQGVKDGPHSPPAWREWLHHGRYRPLRAEPHVSHRSVAEQLPENKLQWSILRAVYDHFKKNPILFERFAADLMRLLDARNEITAITRASVDGGRDAIGRYRLGLSTDPVMVDFALEAKCYDPGTRNASKTPKVCGLKDPARLISRLLHRQFGIFVTTSAVGRQAYKELRDDRQPVVVIAGGDIARLLIDHGHSTEAGVKKWLVDTYP